MALYILVPSMMTRQWWQNSHRDDSIVIMMIMRMKFVPTKKVMSEISTWHSSTSSAGPGQGSSPERDLSFLFVVSHLINLTLFSCFFASHLKNNWTLFHSNWTHSFFISIIYMSIIQCELIENGNSVEDTRCALVEFSFKSLCPEQMQTCADLCTQSNILKSRCWIWSWVPRTRTCTCNKSLVKSTCKTSFDKEKKEGGTNNGEKVCYHHGWG